MRSSWRGVPWRMGVELWEPFLRSRLDRLLRTYHQWICGQLSDQSVALRLKEDPIFASAAPVRQV